MKCDHPVYVKMKILAVCLLTAALVSLLPWTVRTVRASGETYEVSVDSGYLALRNAKAYDSANEIGKLYNGDTVQVSDSSDSTYWYVYSPKYGKYGYVNKNYLKTAAASRSVSTGNVYTVKVESGYLALRSAKAYDSTNEIGRLNTGDTVEVRDTSDSTYWYVYAPKLDKEGYVNKDYLEGGDSLYEVEVESGYLALRNAKAYDAANEIGRLNTGDVVEVRDTTDSAYWYVYAPRLDQYGYVNKDYLKLLSSAGSTVSGDSYTVQVESGYLALRNAKAYDSANEIGKLYTGDTVKVQDTSDSTYWYVYAPGLDQYGYVNKNYLRGGTAKASASSGVSYTVRVESGYLALRNVKAYDSANEIGKLYTGDSVQVLDTGDADYWYVYAPKLDKYGYVNQKYLY